MSRQVQFILMYALLLGLPGKVIATCMDGHIGITREFRGSDGGVLTGKVVRQQLLQDDPADPDGISATLYTVRVGKIYKGHFGKLIRLRSENTTTRFNMDAGQSYLLFLLRDTAQNTADYFVNHCGNSGVLSASPKSLAIVKKLQAADGQEKNKSADK